MYRANSKISFKKLTSILHSMKRANGNFKASLNVDNIT